VEANEEEGVVEVIRNLIYLEPPFLTTKKNLKVHVIINKFIIMVLINNGNKHKFIHPIIFMKVGLSLTTHKS
jgi:hypothetical protein